MTNQRSPFTSVACLTLAGLVSSLLTLWVSRLAFGFLGIFGVGLIFGVVLAACFYLCFGIRSPWKLGGFVITSVVAYPVAFFSLGLPPFGFLALPFTYPAVVIAKALGLGHSPQGRIDPALLFGPGVFGAFLILTAGLFAISSQRRSSWSVLLKALIGSLVGGLLGAIGYALGPSLGFVMWKILHASGGPISSADYQRAIAGGEANFNSMYLLWQTGVALVLGLLWWHGEATLAAAAGEASEAESVPATSERIPSVAKLFFIGAVFLFLYFAGRQVSASYQRTRAQREIARSIAEAPSSEDLPPVQPMSLGEALILRPIAGYAVRSTDKLSFPAAKASPSGPVVSASRVYYYADYVQEGSGGVTVAGPPEIIVSLTEFPNSAWASYQLRNTPTPYAAYQYAKYREKVMKFGNWVVQEPRRSQTHGNVSFYWPSDNNFLTVNFSKGERDGLLKAYLQKYPSDLRP